MTSQDSCYIEGFVDTYKNFLKPFQLSHRDESLKPYGLPRKYFSNSEKTV
jgi:hypothetical protein